MNVHDRFTLSPISNFLLSFGFHLVLAGSGAPRITPGNHWGAWLWQQACTRALWPQVSFHTQNLSSGLSPAESRFRFFFFFFLRFCFFFFLLEIIVKCTACG
jgi:hypothetical protein